MKFTAIKELLQKSHFIILVFITLAVMMFGSGLMDLSQSRKDLYRLMETQSHTLLESITIASQNSLLSNEFLEDISRQRLLNHANVIRSLFEDGSLSQKWVDLIGVQNELNRILIFSREGHRLFSSTRDTLQEEEETDWLEELAPIFEGEVDTLILGPMQTGDLILQSAALSTSGRGAVVVSFHAGRFLTFRRSTGFGSLLNQVASENKQIRFIAFQDMEGILAATGNVTSLEAIEGSDFLMRSLSDSLYQSRMTSFDGEGIFEVAHPFSYKNEAIGLVRIGLSTAPLDEINRRIFLRMIISSIVLIFVALLVITFLFIRHRLDLVQKRYQVVETYSGSIIEHVSDAILVYSRDGKIRIFNSAAENLFGINRNEALSNTVDQVFSKEECRELFEHAEAVRQFRCSINGKQKFLLLSRSNFFDSDDLEYMILVVRDLTEQKQLEEQIQRKQRLTAMGELASGVAHEIRNPLNAIGTIVQQIRKDFIPQNDKEEYDELTGIVYREVRRINHTIQEFLRFARPEVVHPSEFDPGLLFGELKKQYETILDQKEITMDTRIDWHGEVYWDRNQVKQLLINLLQNAIDAIGEKGHIELGLKDGGNGQVLLRVADDGPGMDQKTRDKVFNLYFTTKAQGTGIGLSLVQRIVDEHGGLISLESVKGKGTHFSISLPREVSV